MNRMYPNSAWLSIRAGFMALAALFIALYAAYEMRDFIYGARISITNPTDGETVTLTPVHARGKVENVNAIFMNGRRIFSDTNGIFDEVLILPNGYNILEVSAEDRFGRKVTKRISFFVWQQKEQATSTGAEIQ